MRPLGRLLALVLMLVPVSVGADVIFDVDFNGMSVGLPPTAGGPPGEPSSVTADPGTECLVVESYAGLTSRPVYLSDATTSGSAGLIFSLPSFLLTGQARISWRAAAHQVAHGGEMWFGSWEEGGSPLSCGWLFFEQDGGIKVLHGDGHGGQSDSRVGDYSADQPIAFSVLLNMDAGSFSVSLDGVTVLADVPFVASGAALALVRFGTQRSEPWTGSGTNRYALDDFRVEHFTRTCRLPASYFPLAVGNHWQYECQHDVTQPPDRWLFMDITAQTVFGIPGEGAASYRVEYSEVAHGGTVPSVYRVTYYSINEHGDLGWTAHEFDGNLSVLDSMFVYLRNPVAVGDTCRYVADGFEFTAVVKGCAEPISLLPPFEGEHLALRIEEFSRVGGLPQHLDDVHLLPIGSWPLAGIVTGHSTHWDSYPDGDRDGAYWLVAADIQPTGADVGPGPGLSEGLRLGPGFPNPFHGLVSMTYSLPVAGPVILEVFDVAGRRVRTLCGGVVQEAGLHRVCWDGRNEAGSDLGSGVYLCRLSFGSRDLTRRVVMIR